MRILAIDSSACAAGAAIAEDGKILGEFFLNTGLTHSQTLMPAVKHICDLTNTSPSELDCIAVTNGPGSFTGVRIGVAAVKGMAEAAGIKCVGISTLLAMAYNVSADNAVICCAMDARCNQVYTALFERTDGKLTRLTDDEAISIDELGERLKKITKKIFFVGDGAFLCYNKLCGDIKSAVLTSENVRFQRASGVAAAFFENGLFEFADSPDKLTVNYLRLSQAERELKNNSKNK